MSNNTLNQGDYLGLSKMFSDEQIGSMVTGDNTPVLKGLASVANFSTLPQLNSTVTNNYLEAITESINNQNSPLMQGLKGFGYVSQGLGGLANIYLGLQNYKIAKDQLGMAREQWNMTKEEVNRIKDIREKNTQKYFA